MVFVGVPIDLERFNRLVTQWDVIKMRLVETLGKQYGVYNEEGSFSEKRFVRYLNERGYGWPVHESGRPDLRERTFKTMAQLHPELEALRQLKYCLEKLKLRELSVGQDGFNRCWLAPFASRTGRNQPSNARFIFGPAVWLRDFLIQAKPDWGIAYLDWVGQEFGIAAGLSGDPAMREACESGDIYLAFGKQAGVLPTWATNQTHGLQRDQFRICVLATQYGQKYRSLSEQLNQPDLVGRENCSGFITRFIASFGIGRIIASTVICSVTSNGRFSVGRIDSRNGQKLIPFAISIFKLTERKCSAWPVVWAPKQEFRSALQFTTRS